MSLLPSRFFDDDFFGDFDGFYPTKGLNSMQCDIFEKDGICNIISDMPGFDKKDINIDYNDGYLSINATSNKVDKDEKKNYIRRERKTTSYSRSFYVGDIKADDIKAEFKDGVLTVMLPKAEDKTNKKTIEIK
ncbi:MAG: Hsp20/alpha crystallin family protein [Bacilli bacterium]